MSSFLSKRVPKDKHYDNNSDSNNKLANISLAFKNVEITPIKRVRAFKSLVNLNNSNSSILSHRINNLNTTLSKSNEPFYNWEEPTEVSLQEENIQMIKLPSTSRRKRERSNNSNKSSSITKRSTKKRKSNKNSSKSTSTRKSARLAQKSRK
jgi:hypothetical protein